MASTIPCATNKIFESLVAARRQGVWRADIFVPYARFFPVVAAQIDFKCAHNGQRWPKELRFSSQLSPRQYFAESRVWYFGFRHQFGATQAGDHYARADSSIIYYEYSLGP